MTCVMYQPFSSAFPAYPRAACSADFSQTQGRNRMQEPLDLGPSSSSSLSLSSISTYPTPALLTPTSSGPPSGPTLATSSPPSPAAASSGHIKEESARDGEPRGALYLGANCVLFTYFSGDTSSVVDDHFTRALNQTSGIDPGDSQARSKALTHKAPTPMSARNLPASFWNSSYQYNSNHFFTQGASQYHSHGGGSGGTSGSSSDMSPFHGSHPYLSPALHGLPNLPADPWAYSFPAPSPAMPYPHRPVPYDLSYPGASRFSQNYSSFLMQPSAVRSAQFSAMSGHCDVTKSADHSRSRYTDHRLSSDYGAHHSSFSAIDAPGLQEATKDLYWF